MSQINCLLSQSSLIFSGHDDGSVFFCDLKSGSIINNKLCDYSRGRVSALSLHSDFAIIAAHESDIVLWDRRNSQNPLTVQKNVSNDEIGTMTLCSNTGLVAFGDDDGKVMLCDIEAEGNAEFLRSHDNIVTSVKYSKNHQKVYSTGLDCRMLCSKSDEVNDTNMFDMNTLIEDNDEEEVSVVSLSPPLINDMVLDDRRVYCAMENCAVEVFKLEDDFVTYEDSLYGHKLGVSCVALTQDFLVSAGNDQRLCFWQLNIDDQFEIASSSYNNSKFNCLTSLDDGSVCFSDVDNDIKRVIVREGEVETVKIFGYVV